MSTIRLYTTPDEDGGLDVVMVVPYACADGERGEVSATFSPVQARALGARLIERANAIQRAEAGAEHTAQALFRRVEAEDYWPLGATVKLGWVGPGHQSKPGWAKRNRSGQLVSVCSGFVLDAEMWTVLEERAHGHP